MGIGQSYFRDLIFFEESAYGTMGTTGYKLRVTDLNPRSDKPIITNMVYTGNRMPSTPFQDVNSVGLSFNCPMYLADEIGWILKHGVGEPNTTGGPAYVHTGKVGYHDDTGLAIGDLPVGCSFEIGYNDLAVPLYHYFTGGRINEIVIPFGAGGPAQIQVNAICQDDDPEQTSRKDASPTGYTSEAVSNTDISAITEGGSGSAIILGGEIRISNNLDTSLHTVANDGLIAELPTGMAAVTGTTRFMFKDGTVLAKVVDFTESSLGVTWTQGSSSLAITVPELRYNRAVPVAGSGSGLVLDLSWEAYVGNHADATLLKYVLTNGTATY